MEYYNAPNAIASAQDGPSRQGFSIFYVTRGRFSVSVGSCRVEEIIGVWKLLEFGGKVTGKIIIYCAHEI